MKLQIVIPFSLFIIFKNIYFKFLFVFSNFNNRVFIYIKINVQVHILNERVSEALVHAGQQIKEEKEKQKMKKRRGGQNSSDEDESNSMYKKLSKNNKSHHNKKRRRKH